MTRKSGIIRLVKPRRTACSNYYRRRFNNIKNPAALTSFIAIAVLVHQADRWQIPQDEVGTACTYLLSLVGFLILINISRPLNKYRVGVIILSIIGFGVCAMQFNWLFEMIHVSGHTALVCLLFAGAEILCMIGLTALLERIGKKKA